MSKNKVREFDQNWFKSLIRLFKNIRTTILIRTENRSLSKYLELDFFKTLNHNFDQNQFKTLIRTLITIWIRIFEKNRFKILIRVENWNLFKTLNLFLFRLFKEPFDQNWFSNQFKILIRTENWNQFKSFEQKFR